MLSQKFRISICTLCRVYQPYRTYNIYRYASKVAKQSFEEAEDHSAPTKFSKSAAARHRAASSRYGGPISTRLSYEPHIIFASIGVFLIYFICLREENDIDEELGKSLYSRIEGLEELQLKLSLKFNKESNKSTKDIENRLRQIEMERTARTNPDTTKDFE